MQGVVLAAGEGTRLRPLTADRPKALVEVAGRPLLSYPMDALAELDVAELVVVIGYRGELIRDRFGSSYRGTPITYVEQAAPRGLADALRTAAPHIEGPFLEVHGDNVFGPDVDLGRVIARHGRTDASATLLVEEVTPGTARETGVCAFDAAGEVAGVVEKADDPPSTTAVTGAFAFEPAILDACRLVTPSERGEYELADAIDLLVYAGHPVATVRLEGDRLNVNTPADVERAEALYAGD